MHKTLFAAAMLFSARLVCAQTTTSLTGTVTMGGQPFAADGVMIDTRKLTGVLSFDTERGLIASGYKAMLETRGRKGADEWRRKMLDWLD